MKLVSANNWSVVSRLLDEALDLDVAARTDWLETLRRTQPDVAPALEELLAAHARIETAELLHSLPGLDPALGARHAADGDGGAASHNSGVPLMNAPARLAPDTLVGPYRLIRELGVGGMAHVWLAARADGAFERDIALKLPQVSLLRRHLAERFARERDILARLEHPHIARLYDAGVAADGTPYLAMEFVAGQPLHTYCDERKLDISARLALFDQVLAAVQYAHANLVIHRDLKPSNILVDEQGQVRLLDFGIAKLVADDERAHETQLTQLSGRAMTPDYASPEQILGEPLTIASDVYSLGVVLFELLTGGRPYKLKLRSGSPLAAAHLELAILDAEAASPSGSIGPDAAAMRGATPRRLARRLRGDLDAIVNKALKKQPAERYASVEAFATDIACHLRGLPVQAQPDSLWYRVSKFVLRHKLEAGLAAGIVIAIPAGAAAQAAVLTAIGGGATVALWQARAARRQARRAAEQAERAERVKAYALSIFEISDGESSGTTSLSATEVLERARNRIDTELAHEPEVAIELLTSLGHSMLGLEMPQAVPTLREALRLARERLPAHDPRTLQARLEYADALRVQGQVEEPLHVITPAIELMRQQRLDEPLVMALRLLAQLLRMQARFDDSLKYSQEAAQLADERLRLPRQRRVRMFAHLNHAYALRAAGVPGMLAPARSSYEIAREAFDPASGAVAVTRQAYAIAQTEEGDAAAGLRELAEIVAVTTQRLGPRHSGTAAGHAMLGHAQLRLGYVEEALRSYRTSMDMTAAPDGEHCVPDHGIDRLNLGLALVAARRYAAADAVLDEADAIFSRLFDTAHELACVARAARANALAWCGQEDVAAALLEKIPADGRFSAKWQRRIDACVAATLLASACYERAGALLSRLLASFDAGQTGTAQYAGALALHGATLTEAGRVDAATDALERCCALFSKVLLRMSPDHAEALVSLGRCRLLQGRLEEATKSLEQAVFFWNGFDAENPCNGRALAWQAQALLASGGGSNARTPLERAEAILVGSPCTCDRALLSTIREEMEREPS